MTSQENEPPHKEQPLPPTDHLDLSVIGAGVDAMRDKTEPDQLDILEISNLEDEKLREQIRNLRSDRQLREKYADRILAFLEAYSVLVFVLVVADAVWPAFSIPSEAIVTLVGSTAVAAIGLVGFVAKGLFK